MENNSKEVTVVKFEKADFAEIVDVMFDIFPEMIDVIENNLFKKMYAKILTSKIKKSIKETYSTLSFKDDMNDSFDSINNLIYSLSLSKDDETLKENVDNIINSILNLFDLDECEEYAEKNLGSSIIDTIKMSKDIFIESIYLRREATSFRDWAIRINKLLHDKNNKVISDYMKILNNIIDKTCDSVEKENIDINEYIPSEDDICEQIKTIEPLEYLLEKEQIQKCTIYINNITNYITV